MEVDQFGAQTVPRRRLPQINYTSWSGWNCRPKIGALFVLSQSSNTPA